MILLWRITTQCNFACSFCAYDRRLDLPRGAADATEVERVAGLFAGYAAQQNERLLVSWLGGEPLLWPPLLPLSQKLAANGAASISMTTNGSRLLRPEVRARILADFAEITLSVDGPADDHDHLRGAPGSFARMEKSVRALTAERTAMAAPLKIRVNTVMMRQTVAHFASLCAQLADWGVDEITFNQLGGRDRPEYFPAHRLRPEDVTQLRAILPELRLKMQRRGIMLCANAAYLDRIAATSSGEPLPVADCKPGEAFYFVDEYGTIAPCSFTVDSYGIAVSQLQTIDDIAALQDQFSQRRKANRSKECDDCPSTQIFGKFAA